MRVFSLFCLVFLLSTNVSLADPSSVGIQAYRDGRYLDAYNSFLHEAEKEDPLSQYLLSTMLFSGEYVQYNPQEGLKWLKRSAIIGNCPEAQQDLGIAYQYGCYDVKQDFREAYNWYWRSADQKHPAALTSLGKAYYEGRGIPQNKEKSFELFHQAAELNDMDAQQNLGVSYRDSGGVIGNIQEAVKWFKLAAEQGQIEAQFDLGALFYNGKQVPRDLSKAFKWFTLAAENQDSDAQRILAYMYFKGKGVPKNYIKSYAWCSVSAGFGNGGTESLMNDIRAAMSNNQYEEGKELSLVYWNRIRSSK